MEMMLINNVADSFITIKISFSEASGFNGCLWFSVISDDFVLMRTLTYSNFTC